MLIAPEKAFFHWKQPLLLRMAATRSGRELLGITDMGEPPVLILPNMVRWRQSEHTFLSEFRTHPKYTKIILHRRKEYAGLEQSLEKSTLENSWREHRRAAARLGLAFVGGGAVTTVYPDPHTETATFDGFVSRISVDETIGTIRGGAGTFSRDTDTATDANKIKASTTTDQFSDLYRTLILWDASSIDDGDTVDSAIISTFIISLDNGLSGEASSNSAFVAVASTPASNTAVEDADYGQLGSTSFGTSPNQGDMTAETYEDITLNSSGLSNISLTGISKFGLLNGWDFNNTVTGLTWGSGNSMSISIYFADETGTTKDPKLAVTHSAATARGRRVIVA